MNKQAFIQMNLGERAEYHQLQVESWSGALLSLGGFALMVWGVIEGNAAQVASGAAATAGGAAYGDYFERRRFTMQKEAESRTTDLPLEFPAET